MSGLSDQAATIIGWTGSQVHVTTKPSYTFRSFWGQIWMHTGPTSWSDSNHLVSILCIITEFIHTFCHRFTTCSIINMISINCVYSVQQLRWLLLCWYLELLEGLSHCQDKYWLCSLHHPWGHCKLDWAVRWLVLRPRKQSLPGH